MADHTSNLSPLKRAVLALDELQSRLDAAEQARHEPLAVIGMSCRFPGGANDPDAFWHILRNGKDVISEVPASRWDIDDLFDADPDAPGKMSSRYGGFLDGVDVESFDAQFFRIAPREAASMDPQQRLLLEVAWEALERAGQPQESLTRNETGVFVGIGMNDYSQRQLRSGDLSRIDPYTAAGNFLCFAAGRISYLLGLQGPCLALDTACSSSLVAIHLASQSLRAGECRMAIAGGVQLMLSPEATVAISRTRALAPDGRCKTFDARADGFVRGEGCGVIVLKRLSDALAAGDNILSVLSGSAVNHDGSSAGLTVPNGPAQEAVIRQALSAARVEPAQVSYVEAHGTGTALGDPIEMRALGLALGTGRPPGSRFAVGSVKTNFGHLEAAAGMAGIIKVILSLQHREIPPHLHLQSMNPHISLDEVPAYIPAGVLPWPKVEGRRIAGVSSFGASGTNAHIIVEEYPQVRAADRAALPSTDYLLPLSARNPEALDATVESWIEFLRKEEAAPEFTFEEISRTAGTRRSHHEHRLALAARSTNEALMRLQEFRTGNTEKGVLRGCKPTIRPKIAFVFAGQGPQWQGMACELLDREVVFSKALAECDDALRPHTGWSVIDELRRSKDDSRLAKTEVAQPVIFALQYAVVSLSRSWGIRPDAVVGHSMGEVAACCAAGVLNLVDAARLIALRGQLMSETAGMGRMLSVEMASGDLHRLLVETGNEVSIAAVNGPVSTVISGSLRGMDRIEKSLERLGVPCRSLSVDYAFHSPQMKDPGERLAQSVKDLLTNPSVVPVFSTVTGERTGASEFDAPYWARNLAAPVLFGPAAQALVKAGHTVFLEIGPHPVLAPYIAEYLDDAGVTGTVLPTLRRGQPDVTTMLRTLADLYCRGFAVEWRSLYASGGRIASLPTYPWQKSRYRVDRSRPVHTSKSGAHPLLGSPLRSPALRQSVFEATIAADAPPFLADHIVHGSVVFPAAAYIEMALASARTANGIPGRYLIEDFTIREPLELLHNEASTLQLILHPESSGGTFEIFSQVHKRAASNEWTQHAGGTIRHDPATAGTDSGPGLELVRTRCVEEIDVDAFYNTLREMGIHYGPTFRAVVSVWRHEREALGRIVLPEALSHNAAMYSAHPVLLDACLQIVGAALGMDVSNAYLPVACELIDLEIPVGSTLWSHCRLRESSSDDDTRLADVRIFGSTGKGVGEIRGLLLRRVATADFLSGQRRRQTAEWFYETSWERVERSATRLSVRSESWCIFADSTGVGSSLARLLKEQGASVVLISPSGGYGPERMRQQLREALAGRPPCRGIVHLWSLDSRFSQEQTPEALMNDLERSCRSILHLIQDLAEVGGFSPPRLWVVTRGAQPVLAGPMSIGQSPVWGLGRVIAIEHPELWGGLIDLDPNRPGEEIRALFDEVCGNAEEGQVALRGSRRWIGRLHRLNPVAVAAPSFSADACYLIAGGFGGLGSKLAQSLVEQGARHLVLIGRGLPSEASRLMQREFELSGVHVVTAQVDISDESQVAKLIASIEETLPPLRGIFHAAGVLADGVLLQLGWDRVLDTMAAKVHGAWNLHRQTLHLPLDFFVLFSSAASVLGSPGQGGYSAANSFLDGLAHYRRGLDLPALTVNWGPWEEVGMAASSGENTSRRWAGAGMQKIAVADGLSALKLLLESGVTQAAVMPVSWPQYVHQLPTSSARSFVAALASDTDADVRHGSQVPDRDGLNRLLRRGSTLERRELVLSFVREQIARVLGLDSRVLDSDQRTSSMGLDSLMAVDLRNAIRSGLGVPVPVTKILEGICATELATLVLNQWTAATLMVSTSSAGSDVRNMEEVEI